MRKLLYKYKNKIISETKGEIYSFQYVEIRRFITWLMTLPCKLFHKHEYIDIHCCIRGFISVCKYCGNTECDVDFLEPVDIDFTKVKAENFLKVIRIGVANSNRSKFDTENDKEKRVRK